MAKLYLQKINNGEINPATGAAWRIEDVPMLWQQDVQELLNQETIE